MDTSDLAGLIASAKKNSSLKEIHRVEHVVRKITEECLVVPSEAFGLRAGNRLRQKENFVLNDFSPEQEANWREKFCFFTRPNGEDINKFLALKDSEDFRSHFKIDFFKKIGKVAYIGRIFIFGMMV